MKLTMVGTGYVGLVTGTCFASTGNHVTCMDVDQEKIAILKSGGVPIFEPGLKDLIKKNAAAGRLRFTTDKSDAYRDAEVIFICVGTPPDGDGAADLRGVLAAAADIGDALDAIGATARPKLIVVKSTVPVGTSELVRDTIRKRTNVPFMIASNPEFLKEGAAIGDFMKPDRVVCGTDSEEAADVLRDLYEPFVRQGNPIIIVDLRSSEMTKYASNAMLACKISFINEMANLCELYGADIRFVREGMCADHRIGNQFLYPGLGYGGSCFPKDTLAVIDMGKRRGFHCKLNAAVHAVNQDQRTHFWSKILAHFTSGFAGEHADGAAERVTNGSDHKPRASSAVNSLAGKTLAFWGVAFKPETDDIREAPSIPLMQNALAAGAQVRAFDSVAAENLARALPEVTICDDMYDTLDGADALIVCTEWQEFRHPDFDQIAGRMKEKTVFDGRNIYRRVIMQDLGFNYYSVGRPPVRQSPRQDMARLGES